MSTWICTRQNELTHHGIKGQKWGVRRFQNKDGSLTLAGKKRYDEPNVGRNRNDKVENNRKKQKRYKIPENKSLHRLQLEEKYMKNGMTREEAEQAAAKRIRTEKFVTAVATITITSALLYNKHKNLNRDIILDKNTDFHRIMQLSADDVIRNNGRQYLSFEKSDNAIYKGLFGKQINDKLNWAKEAAPRSKEATMNVYDIGVKAKQEIRIASEKRARDAFIDLYKNDSEFKRDYQESVKQFRESFLRKSKTEDLGYRNFPRNIRHIANKILSGEELTDRELNSKAYGVFNVFLVQDNDISRKANDKFYNKLKAQGMNAIVDLNDSRYGAFKAKMPIITFDGSYDYSKKILSNDEINKTFAKEYPKAIARLTKGKAMALCAVYGGVKVKNNINYTRDLVEEYRKEHPNTKMSDYEIMEMLRKNT